MKTVKLGEVATFIRGVTFKPSDQADAGQGVVVMRTKNVQRELDTSDQIWIPARLVKRNDQYLREGDTLISSANSWNLIGKCCWVPQLDSPAAIGGFVTALRGDSSRIDARYLYHWFSAPRTQATVRSLANQTTNISNLSIPRCEALPIPLPPLDEQRWIAAILDQAHAIRTHRRQILTHLDALPEQFYRKQFGHIAASTSVEELALNTKGSIRTGPFGSQLLHSEFVDEGIAVLGLDNVVGNSFTWGERRFITAEKYEKLKRYTVHGGDVLISIMGTTGRCVVVPHDIPSAINTKHICAITPNPALINPAMLRAAFLWHPQSRAYLRRQTKGSIMDGLNMGIIKGVPVPMIELEQQESFVATLATIDAQRARVAVAAHRDDELFASLQARAFKGEL